VTARPFLKWAGGKRWLAPEIVARWPAGAQRYVEPMVGGGAVFFAVRARFPQLPCLIGDDNEDLVCAYQGVTTNVTGVIELLTSHRTGHGVDYYYALRDRDRSIMSATERAAWLIYMNKTGFNGLYRVNSRGRYNVPFGRYENPMILDEDNLRAVSGVLRGVEIQYGDFASVLHRCGDGDFVYVDPPYVPLTKTAKFTTYTAGGFGDAEQQRLLQSITAAVERGAKVILSNHDTPHYRELLADLRPQPIIETFGVRRTINSRADRRGPVNELLVSWT